MSPDQKGFASLGQFLSGESAADRQRYRDELLSTSPKEFKDFASRLQAVKDVGCTVVFGSQSALDDANKNLAKKIKVDNAFSNEVDKV